MKNKFILKYYLIFVLLFNVGAFSAEPTNPCDINNGFKKFGRISFSQDSKPGHEIFQLPFVGNKFQIKEITIKGNEISQSLISEYFKLDFKTLILDKYYDLDEIKIDFIELLFTCIPSFTTTTNTFLLYITVNDVNNYAPEFVDAPYKVQVKEMTPIGTIIYRKIKAIDKDLPNRPNSQISYSIIGGLNSDYFEFPLSTHSDLAVAKVIHHDVFSTCTLTIKAEDHGVPPKNSNTTIEIEIIDIDDKDPAFTKPLYKATIGHNSPPGTVVTMKSDEIYAFDQDYGINAPVTYSLTSNPDDLFEINSKNGKISLKTALPQNYKNEYNLIAKATQVENLARSALTMVNIVVLNINEHPPKFDKDVYEESIKEDAPYYAVVCKVHATDDDSNPIEYSMITNYDNPFIIESDSGFIKVNRKLDYDTQARYSLKVAANDGTHTTIVEVNIQVINVINKPPKFEQVFYNFKIRRPTDVHIGQVVANDTENTKSLRYTLGFINASDSEIFCISTTGFIYVCPKSGSSGYVVGDDSELNGFDKPEYQFFVYAHISVNDSAEITSRVECRVQIEYKIPPPIERLRTQLSDRIFFLKDPNTFYAFIAVIGGIVFVIFSALVIIIWYKCQRIKHKVPPLFSNTTTTNSTKSSCSSHSSFNSSFRSGSLCINKKTPSCSIINQWEEKGVNSVFYGTNQDGITQPTNGTFKGILEEQNNNNKPRPPASLMEALRNKNHVDLSVRDSPKNGGDTLKVKDQSPKGSAGSKSSTIPKRKSSKSTSRSSTLSTKSLASRNRNHLSSSSLSTPSVLNSMGNSVVVDNSVASADENCFRKEPLFINYETNLDTSILPESRNSGIKEAIRQFEALNKSSSKQQNAANNQSDAKVIYKSEIHVPNINNFTLNVDNNNKKSHQIASTINNDNKAAAASNRSYNNSDNNAIDINDSTCTYEESNYSVSLDVDPPDMDQILNKEQQQQQQQLNNQEQEQTSVPTSTMYDMVRNNTTKSTANGNEYYSYYHEDCYIAHGAYYKNTKKVAYL